MAYTCKQRATGEDLVSSSLPSLQLGNNTKIEEQVMVPRLSKEGLRKMPHHSGLFIQSAHSFSLFEKIDLLMYMLIHI